MPGKLKAQNPVATTSIMAARGRFDSSTTGRYATGSKLKMIGFREVSTSTINHADVCASENGALLIRDIARRALFEI
jgi:hypothetical protein